MNVKNFNLEAMVAWCVNLAASEHTLIGTHDYSTWTSVYFETDHFGGCYVDLHIEHDTRAIYYWVGDKKKYVETTEEISRLVHEEKEKMLKARDMKGVCDFINSQY